MSFCNVIMKNPHENIVKIHAVTDEYIDMELLDTVSRVDTSQAVHVKMHLGIIYIDCKLDNIGTGADGQMKLSGLIDATNEWVVHPPLLWSYKEALKHGMKKPRDIDDWAFATGLET